jgi:hypothetical protein
MVIINRFKMLSESIKQLHWARLSVHRPLKLNRTGFMFSEIRYVFTEMLGVVTSNCYQLTSTTYAC